MSEDIGHECGFALLRLLKPPEYYVEKYGTHFYGLHRMHLLMEKQRNRGQDGAGVANVKLDVPPGSKYLNCEKSVAADPIKDVFQRAEQQACDKLFKAPKGARSRGSNGVERIDPRWAKEHVPFSGEVFLAHVRYGTDSENSIDKCHPVTRESNWMTRNLVLAGNFNITNNEDLFASLVHLGQHPRGLSDTVTLLEKIGHFVDKENNDLYVKYSAAGHDPRTSFSLIAENLSIARILRRAAADWDGGYCIAGLFGHGDAFVMRDPSGIRPAFYYADDEIVAVASEAPLLQTVFLAREELVRPLPPGQALCVKRSGAWTLEKVLEPLAFKQCSFERIYFSRGNDASVYREREELGRLLWAPLLRMVERCGDSLANTVLSFIPNTSELAYYGLVKEAQDELDRQKRAALSQVAKQDGSAGEVSAETMKLLSASIRMEKVIHKDAKIRTFIQEDTSRENLTMHAYDLHYGTVRRDQDVVVALDDSIVRGNTLKNAILRTLDRLGPTRIIILSSCPQIRYPDVYGIDMAKLGDLAAFKAAISMLRERKLDHIITDVYHKCRAELALPIKGAKIVNHMKRIYEPFTAEEITARIAKDVTPDDCQAKVELLFQTIEGLHKALPDHVGDWYFTGDYPTQGGAKVCCRAFVLWMEGSSQRCYGIDSAFSRARSSVLVLGSGSREHALAWKLSQSVEVGCVYVAPGNGGIDQPGGSGDVFEAAPLIPVNLNVQAPSFEEVIAFCKEQGVSLVVVGPEQYLAAGVTDQLESNGIAVFGPTQAAAEIESSKAYAKAFMQRHQIPTAEHASFQGVGSLQAALKFVETAPFDVVVKASGLAAGKGVVVPKDKQEAIDAIRDCLEHNKFGEAGQEIVLERRMEGPECSILALTDGNDVLVLPAAQDHKRAFDGDQGPNTGGMGAFAPTPAVPAAMLKRIEEEILRPTIHGLKAEGRPFVGCLFAGLMLTKEGPKVIEFNCRFGDPETQAVLPLLECDFYNVLLNCVRGSLSQAKVEVSSKKSAVSVVLASGGYPQSFKTGYKVSGLDRAQCVPGVCLFHAGTKSTSLNRQQSVSENPLSRAVSRSLLSRTVTTSGGRVLAATAVGATLTEARERVYCAVRSIQFTDAFYRKDIAALLPSKDDAELGRVPAPLMPSPPASPRNTYLAAGVDIHMDEAIMTKIRSFKQQTERPGDRKSVV